VWQPRRAVDTSTNWRQSLFCCCTASMEQATDGAEAAAIDGLVSSWSENICFILSAGTKIRIDSVMRPRSSSRAQYKCLSYSYSIWVLIKPGLCCLLTADVFEQYVKYKEWPVSCVCLLRRCIWACQLCISYARSRLQSRWTTTDSYGKC